MSAHICFNDLRQQDLEALLLTPIQEEEIFGCCNKRKTLGEYLSSQALINNDRPALQLLLEAKANPNAPDYFVPSMSLLHRAVHNAPDMVDLLLEYNANPRMLDHNQRPPLFYVPDHPSLSAADCGFTSRLVNYGMLGARFSFLGPMCERLEEKRTYERWACDVNAYHGSFRDEAWKGMVTAALYEAIDTKKSSEEYFSAWKDHKLIVLEAGWTNTSNIDGHALSFVLSDHLLALGNTGSRCEGRSGIIFYTINKICAVEEVIRRTLEIRAMRRSRLSLKARASEATRLEQQKQINFFTKDLFDTLGLQEAFFIPQKEQLTGNCAFVAPKLAIISMLMFLSVGDMCSWEEASKVNAPLYEEVSFQADVRAIEQGIDLIEGAPSLAPHVNVDELRRHLKAQLPKLERFLANKVVYYGSLKTRSEYRRAMSALEPWVDRFRRLKEKISFPNRMGERLNALFTETE